MIQRGVFLAALLALTFRLASSTSPKVPKCGINEEYLTCPDDCSPKKCSQLGFPFACSVATTGGRCPTKPGCVCIKDYIKADNATCIPVKQCPSCGGDPNAQKGCGNCRKTCEDYKRNDISCIQVCYDNACDCRPGYVLDTKLKKCVKPQNCSYCPKNEVFYPCIVPCPAKLCSVDERIIKCAAPPQPGDPECKPGCDCIEGYKRSDNGECIPKEKCPPLQPSCPVGQKYGCGNNCNSKCYNFNSGKSSPCPKIACIPSTSSCQCDPEQGTYYSESKGKCVPSSVCKQYP